MFFKFLYVLILSSVIVIAGCTTAPPEYDDYSITKLPKPEKKGVYHKISRGETIWRIAKTYDVDINDIIEGNNIPDVAQIEINQLIFIPGAEKVLDIVFDTKHTQKEFIWPIKGKVVKYFNQQTGARLSKGIDIKAHVGDLVKASRSGRVVFSDYLSGYGKTIVLDHNDGFYTVYAQNAKLLVKLDDYVFKNKSIAHVGGDQDLAYLHFQVRKNAVEDNPLYYLPKD